MKTSKNYFYLLTVGFLAAAALTGCGTSANGSTSGNNDNNVIKDAADDVGIAVEDVADGAADAVDDLVGDGGFDNYSDAHDYFLDTMGSYHADSKFELRDEDKTLNDYQEGSKGYHFHLYDTANNADGEYFGEFFVDATDGSIYKKGENDALTPYPEQSDTGSSVSENDSTK